MTDLELTKLCAEAMELEWKVDGERVIRWELPHLTSSHHGYWQTYAPLVSDAEAMELVKWFDLSVWGHKYAAGPWKYHAEFGHPDDYHALGHGDNHNRAIVECVAKMQAALASKASVT